MKWVELECASNAQVRSSAGESCDFQSSIMSAQKQTNVGHDSEGLLAVIAAAESAGHTTVASILRARVEKERKEKEQTRSAAAASVETGAEPDLHNGLLL